MDGLRIDHPDGLADPGGYLRRLEERGVAHVWVEKILQPGEDLPDWPVEGTIGYEFMADATGLFIDPAGEEPLTALYARLTGERRDFADLATEAMHEEARTTFEPEVSGCRTWWTNRTWPMRSRACRSTAPTWSPRARTWRSRTCAWWRRPTCPSGCARRWWIPPTRTRPRSRCASSRRPARSWPRASRTPPSTATPAWWRSTRSARTPGSGGARPTRSTPPTPNAHGASRAGCSPPRRTTPSARATSARASGRSPGSRASGGPGSRRGGR